MSYTRVEDNKDTVTFITKEDLDQLSSSPSASAESQGAVSASGEINWDCPCLGGMAYGPCGEQFRDAFSCFVYSEEDPKGIDCVEKFQAMQECFRQYPEVYAEELKDENDEPTEVSSDAAQSSPAEPETTASEALPVADPTADAVLDAEEPTTTSPSSA
ncbi:hypothetical protein BCR44DRAFT_51141 [Catenaria anguillulae PL171]|uniref:Mitochondrial intermembrane space import and assembly protein 40 n=1 Tax=Catenaria anguillulae PL171 TaxID=765915 RepID=A0A1Y2I398_9FUNG|nr:hypothetical protein BCR44DRAFT_51141 [Catenaria anguillulae PL171]